MDITVRIKQLPHAEGLELPSYKTADAAGMDLTAAVDRDIILAPRQRALIPTGISVALPPGYEWQIRPRSGLAFKYGISLPNTPATIDADYRGEIKVILLNHGDTDFVVSRGMRIAQAVLVPVWRAVFKTVGTLDDTDRGTGGFGSTGI